MILFFFVGEASNRLVAASFQALILYNIVIMSKYKILYFSFLCFRGERAILRATKSGIEFYHRANGFEAKKKEKTSSTNGGKSINPLSPLLSFLFKRILKVILVHVHTVFPFDIFVHCLGGCLNSFEGVIERFLFYDKRAERDQNVTNQALIILHFAGDGRRIGVQCRR